LLKTDGILKGDSILFEVAMQLTCMKDCAVQTKAGKLSGSVVDGEGV
jgi:hypothetical protein